MPEAEQIARFEGVTRALSPRMRYLNDFDFARHVWFNATATDLPTFLDPTHYLAEQVIEEMRSLRAATSYEKVLEVVEKLKHEFAMHAPAGLPSMEIDADRIKRPREVDSPPQEREQGTKRRRPLDGNAPPPPRVYDWNELRDPDDPTSSISANVDAFLQSFEESICGSRGMLDPDAVERGYLPEDALWNPEPSQATWTIAQCQRFLEMLIPRVPLHDPARPSLLLYLLGELHSLDPNIEARVEVLQNAEKESILNNTSGSGKTRLLLELSCTRWTFYFTFAWDPTTNPYGSRDCCDAIEMLTQAHRVGSTGKEFQPQIVEYQGGDASLESDVNRWFSHWASNAEIADEVYSLVFLARLLIYQRFRRLVANHPEEKAMRAWCLLQVCPSYAGLPDVFCGLLRQLTYLSKESASLEIPRVVAELNAAGQLPFALIFDEAQLAAQQCTTLFGRTLSEADRETLVRSAESQSQKSATDDYVPKPPPRLTDYSRPLLKPAVNSFRGWIRDLHGICRTLIAGTKLRRDLVTEALASSIGKPVPFDDFVDFGVQDTPGKIKFVLEHFLGEELVSGISPAMMEELNFWLQGRHRFISIFVYGVLVTGRHLGGMMNVLSNMLKKLTGRALLGRNHKDLPFLSMDSIIPSVIREPDRISKRLTTFLSHAILEFMVKGQMLKYAKDDLDLVSLGLARFAGASGQSDKTIVINEHLVLVTLFHWVRGNKDYSPLKIWLDQQMGNSEASSGGFSFEDVMLFLFWDWFSDGGQPLNKIFAFKSPEPKWASQNARLISVFRHNTEDGITQLVDKLHTTELTYSASSAQETLNWFSGYYGLDRNATAQCRCPMLKPDTDYGGDVVFGLLLEDGTELKVSAQCKLWSTLHHKKEVEYELWKLSPEGVYKGDVEPDLKPQFDAVMEHFEAPKDFVPKPPRGKPSHPNEVRYEPYPPKYRVLRVLAAFDQTYKVPAGIFGTQAIGSYPFATLSAEAVHQGSDHFSSFKYAAGRRPTARKPPAKKTAKKPKAGAKPKATATSGDPDSKARRSPRKSKGGKSAGTAG